MRRRPCALAGLVLLAALAPASASAQEREPEPRDIPLTTPWDDRSAGTEAARQVEAEIGIVADAALAAYVDAIGQRLARHAPRQPFDYRFAVVDQEAPNAFALPGGFVYISRGLLALTNSEDELANVLGHEIIHAARRHAAAREQSAPAGPLPVLAFRGIASYGRDQEREADRLGQGLAALAGWDPEGMASFLRNLEFTDRLRLGASRIPSFLDTHPGTVERAAATGSRARMIRWERAPGVARDRADYLARLDGLPVGTSGSEGVFREERFLHPDLGFTLRFPRGWELHNTRRAVGAVSPQRDAQVFLESQGRGEDAGQAAREFLEREAPRGLRVERSEPVRLGGREGWYARGRALGPGGSVTAHFTWIVQSGSVYRLTGITVAGSDRHAIAFASVARSFQELTPDLRDSVRETRLRIVAAQPGESLEALSRRTGNEWDLQRTAIMNDVFADAPLASGQLVKVAVSQRYEPES
jgi:predicted Zn-dependent protease